MATMLADQPDAARRLRSLRSVCLGGSVSPPEMSRRLESELGVTVWVLYGLTEACGTVTQTHPWDPHDVRLTTAGTALPGAEVAVFDPATDRPAVPGVDGEVRLRGYQVMLGYLDDPQATAQAVDHDGWLHTGDLGRLDESGRLRIVGRIKDIVNRGGRKLYPAEIEQALISHPGIAAVAVTSLPDPRWGEVAAAFVVRSADHTPSEASLAAWCRRQLAPYKTPERWIFVDELPVTRSGKVQKQRLIDAYLNGSPNQPTDFEDVNGVARSPIRPT
jgi:fatty-acyl-CoA synthase